MLMRITSLLMANIALFAQLPKPGTSTGGGGGSGAVSSVFTRTGDVTAQSGDYTASQVGLGNVSNDAQTKAAILPNTAPSAGQVPVGNAGGTAYAPVAISGDCSITSLGAITCTKLNNVSVATAATASTIAERNASGEVIAVNTVATGKTPMATDTALALGQTPLTTRGDILTVNSTPALARLAKCSQYQTVQGGASDTACDAVHLDQSAATTGILPSGGGGTGNGFFAVSGPASSTKTFTFPNVSANAITDAPSTIILGGIPITSATFIRAVGSNLPTGDNDIYTCGTGKRCAVIAYSVYNAGSGNITYFPELKSGGTYYRLTGNNTPAAGGQVTGSFGIILDAAESISFNTTTNTGLNIFVDVVSYPNTTPLFSAKILGPSSGNNTVYTVTSGKSAAVLPSTSFALLSANTGSLYFVADGSTRNIIWYSVASGGSPGTTNQLIPSAAVSGNTLNVTQRPITLASQDFLVINVDTGNAAQIAWVNVVEI